MGETGGWGNLKTDPKHMKIMSNTVSREPSTARRKLVIAGCGERKQRTLTSRHLPLARPIQVQSWVPREGKPSHPVSRTWCCIVLGNPLASQSNVSFQLHIPQGEERPFWLEAQMQTAPINHRPGTSAAKPTQLQQPAWESCLALLPGPSVLCAVYLSFSHPVFQKDFLRGSCCLVLY